MVDVFQEYAEAHQKFVLNSKNRIIMSNEWHLIFLRSFAEQSFEKMASECLVPKLRADPKEGLVLAKHAVLSTHGLAALTELFPTECSSMEDEIKAYRESHRNLFTPYLEQFRRNLREFPFCSIAVDVMISKGLVLTSTEKSGILQGLCREEVYHIFLFGQDSENERNHTLVHEGLHAFYRPFGPKPYGYGLKINDGLESEVRDDIWGSPIEAAIEEETSRLLQEDSSLPHYLRNDIRKAGNDRGFVPLNRLDGLLMN